MDFEQILRMSNRQKKKLISTAISKVEYEYFEKTQERISKKEKDIAIDFIMFAFSYMNTFVDEKSIKNTLVFMNVFFEGEEAFEKYELDKNETDVIKFMKILKKIEGCNAYIFSMYVMRYIEENYIGNSKEAKKVQSCIEVNIAFAKKRRQLVNFVHSKRNTKRVKGSIKETLFNGEGSDNLKKNRLYPGAILILYIIGWIIACSSKMMYLKMVDVTIKDYIYFFDWKSILLAVIILAFPYEKLFFKYGAKERLTLFWSMYLLINSILAIYLDNYCITVGSVDFIMITAFMFMILLIRELAETEFNVNKKLIIGSSLIVLNYANMLCFTQKSGIVFFMALLHCVLLCLMLLIKNNAEKKKIVTVIIIEIVCGLSVMYFTGQISECFKVFDPPADEVLLYHPFLRINKMYGGVIEGIFILIIFIMIVLMIKQTKETYDINHLCGVISGALVFFMAIINIHSFMSDLILFPNTLCNEVGGFNNRIMLPLLAFIFNMREKRGIEK